MRISAPHIRAREPFRKDVRETFTPPARRDVPGAYPSGDCPTIPIPAKPPISTLSDAGILPRVTYRRFNRRDAAFGPLRPAAKRAFCAARAPPNACERLATHIGARGHRPRIVQDRDEESHC